MYTVIKFLTHSSKCTGNELPLSGHRSLWNLLLLLLLIVTLLAVNVCMYVGLAVCWLSTRETVECWVWNCTQWMGATVSLWTTEVQYSYSPCLSVCLSVCMKLLSVNGRHSVLMNCRGIL